MGPHSKSSIMDRCHTNFGKDEEVLVTFLSGVNQVFLTYLFLAMACSLILEDRGSPYSPVPEDYDFELDSTPKRRRTHHFGCLHGYFERCGDDVGGMCPH